MVLDHLGHGISVAAAPQRLVTPHSAILDGLARGRMGQRPFSAFFIGGGSYSIPRAWAALDPRIAVTVAERSEAHTSELQSLMRISYAVFCLQKQIQRK